MSAAETQPALAYLPLRYLWHGFSDRYERLEQNICIERSDAPEILRNWLTLGRALNSGALGSG